jgi:hypothetical protein
MSSWEVSRVEKQRRLTLHPDKSGSAPPPEAISTDKNFTRSFAAAPPVASPQGDPACGSLRWAAA